ncbi:MAG: adenylate/guanylate cyclase domain-containing protein [Bacteroidales bacterium]
MNELLHKIVSDPDITSLLNSIYDGVYIVNRDREIIFWNESAERITGHNRFDVLNHHCADNILNHIDESGNPLCLTMCPLMQSMMKDKTIEAKIYPLHKDKTRFPVLTRVGPIKDKTGEIVGAIEVFRDITKEEDLRILQEKFNKLIKKYVSKSTYKEVENEAKTGQKEKVSMRDMTILYIDVAGFTQFAERNELGEIAKMLNEVFCLCEVITKEFHGDIDKFIGDAIMATFVDANDAVGAAEKIIMELSALNDYKIKVGKEQVSLHIGINSGMVIHAEIGTSERKDLTVLGDPVNIAAHIHKMSKPNIIYISESTFSRLKNRDNFTFFEKVVIKGKTEPIAVYKSKGSIQ